MSANSMDGCKMDKANACHGFNILRQLNQINGFRAISTLHVVRKITSKPYGYFWELHIIPSCNFCKLIKMNRHPVTITYSINSSEIT
jgi:hypothetical protein